MKDRQIIKLERKIKKLEKECTKWHNMWRESNNFEIEFRRLYNRFSNRKYNSHWPIERFEEAMLNLKEKLP